MAPVVEALRNHATPMEVRVCLSGQHRELVDEPIRTLGVPIHVDLDLMRADQSPTSFLSMLLTRITDVIKDTAPDLVLVHGDTGTAAGAALGAVYCGVPVGHVEAGLRTYDKQAPFPEEINRRLTDVLADLYFAPTELARKNLLSERVADERIWVTGNTGIDALLGISRTASLPAQPDLVAACTTGRLVLVTAHRRENFGERLKQVCTAIRQIVETHPDVQVVWPMHPNPRVRETVTAGLSNTPRVVICPALDYAELVAVLKRAYLVLTDSGGIQEEASALHIPALILRECTERTEGIDAGCAKLVGCASYTILREVTALLDSLAERERMANAPCPYGDGHAAQRIADSIADFFRARTVATEISA